MKERITTLTFVYKVLESRSNTPAGPGELKVRVTPPSPQATSSKPTSFTDKTVTSERCKYDEVDFDDDDDGDYEFGDDHLVMSDDNASVEKSKTSPNANQPITTDRPLLSDRCTYDGGAKELDFQDGNRHALISSEDNDEDYLATNNHQDTDEDETCSVFYYDDDQAYLQKVSTI